MAGFIPRFLAALFVCLPAAAAAQAPFVLDGPPAPTGGEMIARDSAGRATVRAIKLAQPLKLAGNLDDEVYGQYPPVGGLIQVAPDYGATQTERTDIWIMYDSENMYVACRCWDSAPSDKWIANELRRDTNQLRQNDHIGVMFDTF